MQTSERLGGLTNADGCLVTETEMGVSHRSMEILKINQNACDSGLATVIESWPRAMDIEPAGMGLEWGPRTGVSTSGKPFYFFNVRLYDWDHDL